MHTFRPLAAIAVVACLMWAALAPALSPGELDPTFGGKNGDPAGTTKLQLDNRRFDDAQIARLADGRLIVAGTSWPGTRVDQRFVLARFLADGTLDQSFGAGGIAVTPSFQNGVQAASLDLDAQGRIVMAGTYFPSSGGSGAMAARFTSEGAIDTSFNGTGIQSWRPGNSDARGLAVDTGAGGDVYVGGRHSDCACGFITHLGSNGAIDESWGTANQHGATFPQVSSAQTNSSSTFEDLTVLSGGQILAAGTRFSSQGPSGFLILRTTTSGTLDTSYSSAGNTTPGYDVFDYSSAGSEAHAMVVQPDGKALLTGSGVTGGANSETRILIARYLPDGTHDASFGGFSGSREINITGLKFPVGDGEDIALSTGGRIVVGGHVTYGDFPDQKTDLVVARLTSAGQVDTIFNGSGYVRSNFASGANAYTIATGLAVGGGKATVAGLTNTRSEPDDTAPLLLARYELDRPPTGALAADPSTIEQGGSLTLTVSGASDPDGGTIVGYAFDPEGDGSFSAVQAANTFTAGYPTAGQYQARARIVDSDGGVGETAPVTVRVNAPAPVPPRASFTFDPPRPLTGQRVSFDARASQAIPPSDIAKVEWDFDGDPSTGPDGFEGDAGTALTVEHVYATFRANATAPGVKEGTGREPETYRVRLRVTSTQGLSTVVTNEVVVAPNTPPVAALELYSDVIREGRPLFARSTSVDPDAFGRIVATRYDFDGDLVPDVEITLPTRATRGLADDPAVVRAASPYFLTSKLFVSLLVRGLLPDLPGDLGKGPPGVLPDPPDGEYPVRFSYTDDFQRFATADITRRAALRLVPIGDLDRLLARVGGRLSGASVAGRQLRRAIARARAWQRAARLAAAPVFRLKPPVLFNDDGSRFRLSPELVVSDFAAAQAKTLRDNYFGLARTDGTYNVTVEVVDDSGAVTRSAPQVVTVKADVPPAADLGFLDDGGRITPDKVLHLDGTATADADALPDQVTTYVLEVGQPGDGAPTPHEYPFSCYVAPRAPILVEGPVFGPGQPIDPLANPKVNYDPSNYKLPPIKLPALVLDRPNGGRLASRGGYDLHLQQVAAEGEAARKHALNYANGTSSAACTRPRYPKESNLYGIKNVFRTQVSDTPQFAVTIGTPKVKGPYSMLLTAYDDLGIAGYSRLDGFAVTPNSLRCEKVREPLGRARPGDVALLAFSGDCINAEGDLYWTEGPVSINGVTFLPDNGTTIVIDNRQDPTGTTRTVRIYSTNRQGDVRIDGPKGQDLPATGRVALVVDGDAIWHGTLNWSGSTFEHRLEPDPGARYKGFVLTGEITVQVFSSGDEQGSRTAFNTVLPEGFDGSANGRVIRGGLVRSGSGVTKPGGRRRASSLARWAGRPPGGRLAGTAASILTKIKAARAKIKQIQEQIEAAQRQIQNGGSTAKQQAQATIARLKKEAGDQLDKLNALIKQQGEQALSELSDAAEREATKALKPILDLANTKFGPFTLGDNFRLKYDRTSNTWTATVALTLPPPFPQDKGSRATATMTLVNGEFGGLRGTVPADIPLGSTGVTLKSFGFGAQTKPFFGLSGEVTLGIGAPKAPSIAQLTGTVELTFPNDKPKIDANGRLSIIGGALQLGDAKAFADTVKNKYGFSANLGVSLGPASLNASVAGAFQVTDTLPPHLLWEIRGRGEACIFVCLKADALLSNIGLAACGEIDFLVGSVRAGFGLRFSDLGTSDLAAILVPSVLASKVKLYGNSCDVSRYSPFAGGLRTLAADGTGFVGDRYLAADPGTSVSNTLPENLPSASFRVLGQSAPPIVTLHGPDGLALTTPAYPETFTKTDRGLVTIAAEENATYFLVPRPAAGQWTITVEAGSSPVVGEVEVAHGLPRLEGDPALGAPPVASGAVSPLAPAPKHLSGARLAAATQNRRERVFTVNIDGRPGQEIVFVEIGPNTEHTIGIVNADQDGSHRIDFVTEDSGDPSRTVVARVLQDGLLRGEHFVVPTFTAAPLVAVPRVPDLDVTRLAADESAVISWDPVKTAQEYDVMVATSDGRDRFFTLPAGSKRLRVDDIDPHDQLRVEVTTVALTGREGKTARIIDAPDLRPFRIEQSRVQRPLAVVFRP